MSNLTIDRKITLSESELRAIIQKAHSEGFEYWKDWDEYWKNQTIAKGRAVPDCVDHLTEVILK